MIEVSVLLYIAVILLGLSIIELQYKKYKMDKHIKDVEHFSKQLQNEINAMKLKIDSLPTLVQVGNFINDEFNLMKDDINNTMEEYVHEVVDEGSFVSSRDVENFMTESDLSNYLEHEGFITSYDFDIDDFIRYDEIASSDIVTKDIFAEQLFEDSEVNDSLIRIIREEMTKYFDSPDLKAITVECLADCISSTADVKTVLRKIINEEITCAKEWEDNSKINDSTTEFLKIDENNEES